jgi:hypothetical protein
MIISLAVKANLDIEFNSNLCGRRDARLEMEKNQPFDLWRFSPC